MKILIAWPPVIPSYFNAGHRLALYQLATYLRRQFPSATVKAIDFGALNYTWKEVADTLVTGFDVIIVQNDLDCATGFGRFVSYCRALSKQTRILSFGRLSARQPAFFERYPIDAIVESGDPELAISAYIESLAKGELPAVIPGLRIRDGNSWSAAKLGLWLDTDQWTLPDVSEVPHEAYHRLYARDANKFCGIPGRSELVIPVARGCPVGCYFCEVPLREGLRDRRMTPKAVLDYIQESRAKFPFEYVSMYAPTFTLRDSWVRELCALFIAQTNPIPWKCTTTLSHLSHDLIQQMGQAGCMRISVGLESAETEAQNLLPSLKKTPLRSVLDTAQWCTEAGIELTCFVVLGMPGTSAESTLTTVQQLQENGIRVRPTVYADYGRLHAKMTETEVDSLNRQILDMDGCADEEKAIYYSIYYGDVLHTSLLPQRIKSFSQS